MNAFNLFENDIDIKRVNKKCSKCFTMKNITLFPLKGNNKYRNVCKECINGDWTYRLMSNISSRTKTRNRPYSDYQKKAIYTDHNITKKYIEKLREQQNGLCYWTKIPIDFTLKDQLRKPSLDRINNNKGYEIGNVVLSTLFANLGRRDVSKNDYIKFLDKYLNL